MSPHLRSHKKMSNNYNDIPVGILAIQKSSQIFCPRVRVNKELLFKISILVLTYISYTCYHLSRKPISVVKSVLHGNCSVVDNKTHDCGYAPFDGPNSSKLFGLLDTSFLFSYAIAMFVSGFIAERVSLRYFLALGMLFSGIFTYLFGYARTVSIHSIWFFVIVQALGGICQTTGWPGVVTLVGRWFGKSKRGLIFGIWNSHTSIGNILGTLIAAVYVETNWALSFIVPGIIIGVAGFVMFLFLVDAPEIVGIHPQSGSHQRRPSNDSDIEDEVTEANYEADVAHRATERTPILTRTNSNPSHHTHQPINLIDALYIPGVVEFSLCLFFTKLVSYTFIFWLPLYIESSSNFGPAISAQISTLFDVGGIIGAIAAGMISDYSGMPACACSIMLFIASPLLFIYEQYGAVSISISVLLLIAVGIFVNGPYALITTSVSAELGQHSSLEGNAKALATVTAIIDGTGSVGAAIGPLLAGVISSHGWQNVFYMLITSDVLALLFLVRLVVKELTQRRRLVRIRIE